MPRTEIPLSLPGGLLVESYPFTTDSRVLDSRKPTSSPRDFPEAGREVQTPLQVQVWEKSLAHHPDRWYVNFLIRGMREGFRIGFRYGVCTCTSATSNMQSAQKNSKVVDDYLHKEVALGRVLGPWESSVVPNLHISRFGVIPKGHQIGKWRLILDLSHPV